MAKANRISVNALEKVADQFVCEQTFDWNGLQVVVKPLLSLTEFVDFVRSVTKCCFSNTTGEYMPEARDICIRSNILDHYANFTMPKSSAKQFDLIWRTDAVDRVMEHVNMNQFNELLRCIDKDIEYKVASDIERTRCDTAAAVQAVSDFIDKFNEIFDGVSTDDVKAMVGAISEHGIDEEKLAQAVLANHTAEDAKGPHLVAAPSATATL